MLEPLSGKPTQMTDGPMPKAIENPTMPEKKGQQLLAFLAQIFCRPFPSPHKVANSFIDRIRHPYPCQFASPMQTSKRYGITAVRLHPIAGLLRNQRRRNY